MTTNTHPGHRPDAAAVAGPATTPVTEDDYRRQIGRRARIARTALGLNQGDLAIKAGVTRNYVSATERGAIGLDTWRLRQLANALGVPLGWLLGLTDHPALHGDGVPGDADATTNGGGNARRAV